MRYLATILLLAACLALWAQGETLPDCYYTYDEISQMLTDYQSQHPDIAKKVQIGLTQHDQLPIWAFRISDNVNQDEEEPALLFVGQVHAEEVLGVQTTMSNIAEILANRYQQPYSQWINFLDTWFVPTFNPEGHNVVTANLDTSYRKNKRDNNLNGIFDYSPLVGYDIDGVDFNRNFDFNWVHGDTLLQPGGLEVWDYYRGPYPMSESENQAMQALGDQYPFVYSICWHSSRTGNLSEKCYYPFNWKEVRPSPDVTFAQTISNGIAGTIYNEAGTGTYESLPNLSRKGAFHDWMYQQYGTFQILIECGTRNLQPPDSLMLDTVSRCSNGVRWLLNRALPFSSLPSNSMLTGNIRDAVTNNPLQAQIIIMEHDAPWFRPRLSDPDTGRYWKALPTGQYTVKIRKTGYHDLVVPNVMVNNLSWTTRNFLLEPKAPAALVGSVRSGATPLNAAVRIYGIETEDLDVNGDFVHNTFEGEYQVEVTAPGYYPYLGTMNLHPGTNEILWNLSPATVIFAEDWESGTDGWTIEGPWVLQDSIAVQGSAITDSWGGNGFYATNCNVWISPAQQIYIPGSEPAMLTFSSHLYTEHGYDPAMVEVSTDNQNWTVYWTKSGKHDYFNREYMDLSSYAGQNVWLRFRLSDQSIHVELTDPGWTLDDISVIRGYATSSAGEEFPALPKAELRRNFPNPFNPSTTISFSLAEPMPVRLGIYNLKGQLVKELLNGVTPRGDHQLVWDGRDKAGRQVSSGLYFYRLQGPEYSRTFKMMLAK